MTHHTEPQTPRKACIVFRFSPTTLVVSLSPPFLAYSVRRHVPRFSKHKFDRSLFSFSPPQHDSGSSSRPAYTWWEQLALRLPTILAGRPLAVRAILWIACCMTLLAVFLVVTVFRGLAALLGRPRGVSAMNFLVRGKPPTLPLLVSERIVADGVAWGLEKYFRLFLVFCSSLFRERFLPPSCHARFRSCIGFVSPSDSSGGWWVVASPPKSRRWSRGPNKS